MPLYLATHRIEVVTAKVPLCMVLLLDHVKHNKGTSTLPAELRPRMVMPTDSTISTSLWDAPSAELLVTWLYDNLGPEVTHEVHEVQEEFSWGITFELTRARAAEKVAAGSRSALDKISATAAGAGGSMRRQLEALDQRTGVFTATENAINRMRSATTTTTTGAGAGGGAAGVGSAGGPEAAGTSTTSAMLAANVSAGITKASSTLSWLGSALKEQIVTATAAATGKPPSGSGAATQPSGYDHFSPLPSDMYDAHHHTPADEQQHKPPGSTQPQQHQHQQQQQQGGLLFMEDDEHAPVATMPQLPVSSPAVAPAPGTPLSTAPGAEGTTGAAAP